MYIVKITNLSKMALDIILNGFTENHHHLVFYAFFRLKTSTFNINKYYEK